MERLIEFELQKEVNRNEHRGKTKNRHIPT